MISSSFRTLNTTYLLVTCKHVSLICTASLNLYIQLSST